MAMQKYRFVPLLRSPVVHLLFTGMIVIALPVAAPAQEWQLEPILKVGVVTDDNAQLSIRTDEEVELSGSLVDAKVNINYSLSDTTSFFLEPRALIRNYPGESAFDAEDFFLRSQFRHRARLSTYGFRVNFDQQSVRTGERTDTDLGIDDPDEIPQDDTGLVGLDGDRSRWRISPFWNYQFSQTSSFEVAFDYFATQYDEIFAGRLLDYTDTRLDLSYRHAFSNINTGILTLTGRRFDPDDNPFDPDSTTDDITGIGLLTGFEYALSDKSRLVAMMGVENTDQSTGQSSTEVIGNITLTRDLETISLFARYQRAVTANGSGTVEVRDTVSMNFNRRLNERISAGLGVRAYHAEGANSSSSASNRNYVQLQTKFTWYLSQAFVVEADYRYTIMDRSNATGARSNSNEIALWIVYQPKTIPKL